MSSTTDTLSPYTSALGTLIFCISYVFIAFKINIIPIGRVCGTLVCAVLAIVFQVLAPAAALAAINLDTLALLFGTMVMTILLEREGFFDIAQNLLTYKCSSAIGLLGRVSTVSGVLAALITNDTVCVFFTPIVIQLCERYDLPHGVFLLALATSSNIGSACSPTGNPQNMIIASLSGLKFGQFISANILAVVVSMCINLIVLIGLYYKQLWGKTFIATNAKFIRSPESDEYVRQHTTHKHDDNNGDSCSASIELHDVQVTPTNAQTLQSKCDYERNGLQIPSAVDHAMNGFTIDASSIDQETMIDLSSHAANGTLRHRNNSTGKQSMNQPNAHSSGDVNIDELRNGIVDDEPMKASEIMKLPVREASIEHPRQANRRLVMVSSCVVIDVAQDPIIAPPQRTAWRSVLYYCRHPDKLTIYIVTLLGVIAAFGAGSPLEWASVGGATFMLLVDWREPDATLQKVDWSLLVFFSALFMVVQALNNTGVCYIV